MSYHDLEGLQVYYGKTIVDVELIEIDILNGFVIKFEDVDGIAIYDAKQECCEHRYMTTDDDLKSLIGSKLLYIEEKPGEEVESDYGNYHETMFIEIGTDKGFVTITTHNEHNGYYGGFSLQWCPLSKMHYN